ncbi:hypothetical protein Lfu02_37420 [Longispora fulva]|uniref:RecA/RadA recombinase n=1 Tax=Longispora fulva TaxID=619741 RepID=A0A8J7GZT8_9ACTN|nr:AAA family ATPase [Longispora fulva]MBG6141481.1 RecA/RadA recombinase [Longispora fulva]GIG59370.1 hypothetical protein Lfu02_37420 [Longispora fulva]
MTAPARFIGRRAEIARALGLLTPAPHGSVLDVVGMHGIGKTFFLQEMVSEARAAGSRVFYKDLADDLTGLGFDERHGTGPDAGLAVLVETLVFAGKLARSLLEAFGRSGRELREVVKLHAQLRARLEEGSGNTVTLGAHSSVENMNLRVVEDVARVMALQAEFDEAFVGAWPAATGGRPVLLAIDSFERVVDDEIGRWLLKTVTSLPNTLTLLARTPTGHSLVSDSAHVHREPLAPFEPAEVAEYLQEQVGPELVDGDIAEIVYTFTHGHPGGVDLAGRYLLEHGAARQGRMTPAELRREFARLPEREGDRWGGMVDLILGVLRGERRSSLTPAVECAAVVGRFDAPMMVDLLGLTDTGEADRVLKGLEGLRLAWNVPDEVGERSDWYRLHEFIRISLAEQLRTGNQDRWLHLHDLAARHCYDRLLNWEDDRGEYGTWHCYENPHWQEYKQAWLHHTGQTTPDPRLTFVRFLVVFLEAFWWWGCYHPFPFNRQLIDDWERFLGAWGTRPTWNARGGSPKVAGQRLSDALVFLIDHYPHGHDKSRPSQPWEAIRRKLLQAQDICGLAPGGRLRVSEEDTVAVARARGLLDIFLAHTRRFADPADPGAVRYYDSALTAFVDDHWVTEWLLFERADLDLERGLLDEALAGVDRAARAVLELADTDDEWDHELAANLHRVRADVLWARGEPDRAAEAYRLALVDAYWFQGSPHEPDAYSARFYKEITSRAVDRIVSLAATDPDAAVRFAMAVRPLAEEAGGVAADGVRELILTGSPEALADRLLPRGPAEHELSDPQSEFLDELRDRREFAPEPRENITVLLRIEEDSPE